MNKFGQNTWIDKLSLIISSSVFLVSIFLTINILIIMREPIIGWSICLTMVLAVIIHFLINDFLIKRVLRKVFFKPRPFVVNEKIKTIGARHNDSTFPSGHMSSISAALIVLFYYYPQTWPISVVFLILLGLSRLHNGMHYLLDVISGVFFGLGYAYLAIIVFERIFT